MLIEDTLFDAFVDDEVSLSPTQEPAPVEEAPAAAAPTEAPATLPLQAPSPFTLIRGYQQLIILVE